MPIDVTTVETASITLDEFVDRVSPLARRLSDEDTLASLAPSIIQLANNRTFLGDILLDFLTKTPINSDKHIGATFETYTSHVVMLRLDRKGKFIVRAAIWPSVKDYVYKVNGDKEFSFNYPHDHNFSFLTVGYFGPGYESDYYEIDPDSILGVPGEATNLKFIERSRLYQGKSLVYRAHRDVHVQYPPSGLSISLNLIGSGISTAMTDQYIFDVEKGTLKNAVSAGANSVLLDIAMKLGGDQSRHFVEEFANKHPIDSIRYRASRALAGANSKDQLEEFLQRASRDSSAYFRAMASSELAATANLRAKLAENRK